MTLLELTHKYYELEDYNCAETLIHAANEYYHLSLHEEDMKMMAGFGGGMYTGMTCGALTGCIAALSKIIITTKAHESQDIRRVVQSCIRHFKQNLQGTQCVEIKPIHHQPDTKCLPTCLLAAQALEQTIQEFQIHH